MTTLAPSRTARTGEGASSRRRDDLGSWPSLFDGTGGEPTLDELLAGVWEGLTAHAVVACPVCGEDMAPEYGAHALPLGGRCRACGSTLA